MYCPAASFGAQSQHRHKALGTDRKLFLAAVLARHRCSHARLAQADTGGTLGAIRYDLLYHRVMEEKESLLEFPCDFPIKAIGRTDSGFEALALGIVRHHVPEFETDDMRSAVSRKGNYLSVTFTVRVSSRQQLDDLYRGLTSCKAVLMVI